MHGSKLLQPGWPGRCGRFLSWLWRQKNIFYFFNFFLQKSCVSTTRRCPPLPWVGPPTLCPWLSVLLRSVRRSIPTIFWWLLPMARCKFFYFWFFLEFLFKGDQWENQPEGHCASFSLPVVHHHVSHQILYWILAIFQGRRGRWPLGHDDPFWWDLAETVVRQFSLCRLPQGENEIYGKFTVTFRWCSMHQIRTLHLRWMPSWRWTIKFFNVKLLIFCRFRTSTRQSRS